MQGWASGGSYERGSPRLVVLVLRSDCHGCIETEHILQSDQDDSDGFSL
jgi:hypothetical protein